MLVLFSELKHLVLKGNSPLITDVGICYGFGFTDLRKLEFGAGSKVIPNTNWGAIFEFTKPNKNKRINFRIMFFCKRLQKRAYK